MNQLLVGGKAVSLNAVRAQTFAVIRRDEEQGAREPIDGHQAIQQPADLTIDAP